jgi:hypothetical protein
VPSTESYSTPTRAELPFSTPGVISSGGLASLSFGAQWAGWTSPSDIAAPPWPPLGNAQPACICSRARHHFWGALQSAAAGVHSVRHDWHDRLAAHFGALNEGSMGLISAKAAIKQLPAPLCIHMYLSRLVGRVQQRALGISADGGPLIQIRPDWVQ